MWPEKANGQYLANIDQLRRFETASRDGTSSEGLIATRLSVKPARGVAIIERASRLSAALFFALALAQLSDATSTSKLMRQCAVHIGGHREARQLFSPAGRPISLAEIDIRQRLEASESRIGPVRVADHTARFSRFSPSLAGEQSASRRGVFAFLRLCAVELAHILGVASCNWRELLGERQPDGVSHTNTQWQSRDLRPAH